MAETPKFEEIAAIVERRRADRGLIIEKMMDVNMRYDGDFTLPIPDNEIEMPPLTPALIVDAVDQVAIRANSVDPGIWCPSMDPSKDTGVNSKEYSAIRRKALHYTWNKSYMQTYVMGRAYRQLAGYATTSFSVVPDFDLGYPCIKIRDPLSTFPDPKTAEDPTPPENVAFIYGKSAEWIMDRYPEAAKMMGTYPFQNVAQTWDMVEWIDEQSVVIGLLGPRQTAFSMQQAQSRPQYQMELRRWPNKAGRCTAYIPTRVTLNKFASHIANNVGIVDLMAWLMWLDVRATEKSIYPDRYLIGKSSQNPTLQGGQWFEGTTGKMNVVLDAESIGEMRGTPDPNNKQTIGMLENNFSKSAGLVGPMSGEINGALRSGRTVDSLMAASTDPRIAEIQRIAEQSLQIVNNIVFDTYKGYWGDKKFTVFPGFVGDSMMEFTPNTHFESNENLVTYPIPGADMSQTTVNLNQLLGAKAISRSTYRQLHPWIKDPENEDRLMVLQDLLDAINQGTLQNIVTGNMALEDAGRVYELVSQGKTLIEAEKIAQAEAQARQAAQAPPPAEGQGVAPETQAGINQPGAGAESQPPAQGGNPAEQMNQQQQMQQILQAMSQAPISTPPQGTPTESSRIPVGAINAGH